jgi:hypothetical protein
MIGISTPIETIKDDMNQIFKFLNITWSYNINLFILYMFTLLQKDN